MNWPLRKPDVAALAAAGTIRTIQDGRNAPVAASSNVASKPAPVRRPFTTADKSFIAKVHGYMPRLQLLAILNDRMRADVGDGAAPYTIAQLHTELRAVDGGPADAGDWSSLRKIVARAKRDGTLDCITRQVIDDFAVVYSLSSGQVLGLQDALLQPKDDQ